MIYDSIIIGGGISGLYLGNHLSKTKENFLILETKGRLGGRIKSITHNDIVYEAGAFRISETHKRVLQLIKKCNLFQQLVEIKERKTLYSRNGTNKYHTSTKLDYQQILSTIITNSKKKELMENNIYSLLVQKYDTEVAQYYLDYNGYHHINYNSNALVLKTIKQLSQNKFYSLKGGLQQLIEILKNNIPDKIKTNTQCLSIEKKNNLFYIQTNSKQKYQCKKIILTIPKENLLDITYLDKYSHLINSVSTSPYLRIYAIYPKNNNNQVWFHDINKIVTDTIIRQIIPIDKDIGLIEVCYVDYYNAIIIRDMIINGSFESYLQDTLNTIFPNKNIPKPNYLNYHYWKHGNHFWLPHNNPSTIINDLLHPEKNIYICGESYSYSQGWIEGSLESCDKVIQLLHTNNKKTKKQKPHKRITLKEVEKHNTIDDGWIILDNKVYNVTNFINKHPGGNIIKIGLGKDITKLFKSIQHSDMAFTILQKYLIGYLT